jgi:hypothetical protein
MLGLPAGEGMLVSEFLVGDTLSSAPPGRRHTHRNQQDNRQQTAAKHFILSPYPPSLADDERICNHERF